ncbi:unnamed protein product [Hydatigera taeniaeformis]|uniref:MRG domain-containing protein n=1 Tax=Hydatigena taeniaeformis TaxID=6205 RepID=A0A0R3WV85_HYDTA|nr:unnamed protein product [Hydatigera taeniaeformis]
MSPVAHKYEVGDRLFCFEPDPSKAKLIYQAKVTQLCGFASSGRSRVPLYCVHFLGWKQKWDREVSEDLLMDINSFTRMLKQKIDELAIKIKDKEKRKERIDTVLMSAAKARDDVDWDSLPGTWKKDEVLSKARASSFSQESSQFQPQSEAQEEMELDPDSLAQSNFESLEAHANFAPKIKLPNTLYAILESHCRPFETARGSSVRPFVPVPSWCSVLHLLQTYLNAFPYFMPVNNSVGPNRGNNVLFPSIVLRERFSKAAAAEYMKTDRSRRLCAEFCSSVRILFDALLEEYLLYPNEQRKHS